MIRRINLALSPENAGNTTELKKRVATKLRCKPSDVNDMRVVRKSVDARRPAIMINLDIEVFTRSDQPVSGGYSFKGQNVSLSREILIAGSGPAGLFAALRLIELGLRPVIFERGKDVSERKKDLARISREHFVDPDSNYCFGEGGAGTFSDGKLYTRSKKRGDNRMVIELLHFFGAEETILYEAHPHIGTDKLPAIIRRIREKVVECGGVFLLNKRITDIIIEGGKIAGVKAGREAYRSDCLILATGHSARDIYHMLDRNRIALEIKPFAMGVRVEHPQDLIDRIQYHGKSRGEYLPAAAYSFARQVSGRGVYSFCMCPGGFIVPAATDNGEVVVNGMSPSRRNSVWANSGIVTEIRLDDLADYSQYGALAGLKYQAYIEKIAWEQGGKKQTAPAQRLADYVSNRSSSTLPPSSYFPGIVTSQFNEWLPEPINNALKEGFNAFGRLLKGYLTNEAVILGIESRSSSPVRIPRDLKTLEHIEIRGLYPCGEGSGYAGGIVSSAIDGIRVADVIVSSINS